MSELVCVVDKDLLQQLRKAVDVWFHGDPPAEYGPGTAVMSFRQRHHKPGEAWDSVPTTRISLPVYGIPKGRTVFASLSSCQFHEEWATIVRHVLRVGDKLSLEVGADSWSNGYVRAACGDGREKVQLYSYTRDEWSASLVYEGLHVDTLKLRVERGNKRLTFLIDHGICPENSARMVRLAA